MTVSLALDGLIVILLALTIGYAIVLNRKLKRLRDGEGELRAMIDTFDKSAATAEANLSRIKGIAEAAGTRRSLEAGNIPRASEAESARAALAPLVEEARKLAADLDLLIARGDVLGDELGVSPAGRDDKQANGRTGKPMRPAPSKTIDAGLFDALRSVR